MILGALALCTIPALRAAIRSYRAHKPAKDILVDAVEAAVDTVDKQ